MQADFAQLGLRRSMVHTSWNPASGPAQKTAGRGTWMLHAAQQQPIVDPALRRWLVMPKAVPLAKGQRH